MSKHFPDVIEAPEWLKERMRKVQALPPPTLEEVRTAWAASAEWVTNIWSIDSEGRKVIR